MWTLALVPDFWVAEQGMVWAATAEDTKACPVAWGWASAPGEGPNSNRVNDESDMRWEVLPASDLTL